MKYPVYIASKGRPDSGVFKDLPEATLVVEPQEHQKYVQANPKHRILILDQNDKGLPYVRQWVLNYVRNNSTAPWFWMVDDNLTELGVGRENDLTIEGVLEFAESYLDGDLNDATIVGFERKATILKAKSQWKNNVSVGVCVAVNVMACNDIDYTPAAGIKADVDFIINALSTGGFVARLGTIYYDADKLVTKDPKQLKAACANLAERWPGICTYTEKGGASNFKVDWKVFQANRLPEAPPLSQTPPPTGGSSSKQSGGNSKPKAATTTKKVKKASKKKAAKKAAVK